MSNDKYAALDAAIDTHEGARSGRRLRRQGISRRQINTNLSDPLSADRRQSQRGNGGTRPDSSPGTPRLNDDPLTVANRPQTTPPEVLAAQEALQRAEHARLVAQRELERATQARFEAAQVLQYARVRADSHLPRARIFVPAWQERIEVVIDRRTKKEIVTRAPGQATEQRWRKMADGKWRQWPDRGSVRTLEVAE